MARRPATVLLAAVEMGNKTLIPYREETFCLLLVNSWEILLKARIVQQNRNRLESILEKESNGHFVRDPQTQSPHTIKFMEALNRVSVRENVRTNLLGINAIRTKLHIWVYSLLNSAKMHVDMGVPPSSISRNSIESGSLNPSKSLISCQLHLSAKPKWLHRIVVT